MFSITYISAVIFFAISTSFTPGPNNFLLLASGIKFGVKKTLGHILGIAVGFPLMLMVVGVFFNKVFSINPVFFNILSAVGMVYLLYLGYQIIFSDLIYEEKEISKPITFTQAVLFQWVNPKAWIMALSIATTYLTSANFYLELEFVALVFFAIGFISSVTWTLFGKTIKNIINIKLANIILGIMLIVSILQIIPEKF